MYLDELGDNEMVTGWLCLVCLKWRKTICT